MNYYQYFTNGGGGGGGGTVQLQVRSAGNVWTDVGFFAGNLYVPVTSTQANPVWITGTVHMDNPGGGGGGAVTQGGAWATLVSGTVDVTAALANPASVAVVNTPSVSQAGTWNISSVAGVVQVSQSNTPAGTASVSMTNSPTVTATFTGSVNVTSTIANPVNVTGSVFVVNSQGSDVRITGTTVTLPVTSSLAAPVWITGTTTVTGTFAAVFSGTQIVTSSQAAPVWVTGTVTMPSSPSSPSYVAVTGAVPVSMSNNPVVTATFTGTIPVSMSNSPVVTATFTGSVSVNTGTFPVVTVTASSANPVSITGTVIGEFFDPVPMFQTGAMAVVDPGNSTTASLAAGAAFTGTWTNVLGYASIAYSIQTDVTGAADAIQRQWSQDGVNVIAWSADTLGTDRIGATSGTDGVIRPHAKYFRIIYHNGTAPQSFFRLQTILGQYTPQGDTTGIAHQLLDGDDALITKSIIAGRSLNTTSTYLDAVVTSQDVASGPGVIGLVTRQISPAYGQSSFGEQRVSIPYTLFDMNNKYGRNTRLLDSTSSGSGSVTDVLQQSAVRLYVGTGSADYAKMRSNQHFQYQAGRGMRFVQTVIHANTGSVNQQRDWGLFHDNDGLMWRVSGTSMNIVRRTSAGESGSSPGAPFEQVVSQSAWNQDPFNGTGPSGVTLDVTKGNIYETQYQWLGVGTVQFFINGRLVHVMDHPNKLAFPYMASGGTLPMSWEIKNTGVAVTSSMTVICANVTSQSGEDPPQFGFTFENNAGVAIGGGVESPAIALRVSSTFNGADNRTLIFPTTVNVDNPTNTIVTMRVYLNPASLTGATFAATVPALCGVDIDTAASAFTGGELLARTLSLAANAGGGYGTIDLKDIFKRNARILQRLSYAGTQDVLLVTLQAAGGTITVYPSISWTCVP